MSGINMKALLKAIATVCVIAVVLWFLAITDLIVYAMLGVVVGTALGWLVWALYLLFD